MEELTLEQLWDFFMAMTIMKPILLYIKSLIVC